MYDTIFISFDCIFTNLSKIWKTHRVMFFDFVFQQIKQTKTIQDQYNAEMFLYIDTTDKTTIFDS